MPKRRLSDIEKVQFFCIEYPFEFTMIESKLFCNICSKLIKCEKKFHMDSHIKTNTHNALIKLRSRNCSTDASNPYSRIICFPERLIKLFTRLNIPLNKFHSEDMKLFFEAYNEKLLFVKKCRQIFTYLADRRLCDIKKKLEHKKVFLVTN
ncbi:hypothetical protein A3Q56_06497 [Intoshia linei]|uniref:Uncharacterized protein n=1 Tax=Intoshia linei TaxID=1819745 RepID=A0A177AUU6_9BILA|nr:hypothetical protein A3Q56_06497 [Intoshia linei]